MGRRRRGPGSSLDLLLDTICNTFGGVVFIAILVIVLLQMTGSTQLDAPPGESEQEELVAWEAKREAVEARLKSLRDATAQQEAILEQIVKPDDAALAVALTDLQSRRDQLKDERIQSLGEVSQAQINTNEVASKLASLERDLQDAPSKVASLETALKTEIAKRTEDARLPVQRDTDKREIPFLLTAGRVHCVYVVHPDGSVADSGECRSGNGAGPQAVEAVPGTGIAVEDDDSSRAALGARLKSLDSQSDYLAVFVWPDSFAQFRLLKDVLVENRFEYRLVPMAADGKVVRNAPRTSAPKVQ